MTVTRRLVKSLLTAGAAAVHAAGAARTQGAARARLLHVATQEAGTAPVDFRTRSGRDALV